MAATMITPSQRRVLLTALVDVNPALRLPVCQPSPPEGLRPDIIAGRRSGDEFVHIGIGCVSRCREQSDAQRQLVASLPACPARRAPGTGRCLSSAASSGPDRGLNEIAAGAEASGADLLAYPQPSPWGMSPKRKKKEDPFRREL